MQKDHCMYTVPPRNIFLFTAPSGPPTDLQATPITSRSALLSWTPPSPEQRNGVIVAYSVLCVQSEGLLIALNSTTAEMSIDAPGLAPASQYTCQVSASTHAGEGPFATITFSTEEDGKFNSNMFINSISKTRCSNHKHLTIHCSPQLQRTPLQMWWLPL